MSTLTHKITRRDLDVILSKHSSNERVLDVGSGASSYDRFFPNRLTVDIDPAKNPDIVADAQDLPFDDEEFGLVICTEVLTDVEDPRAVAAELMRVVHKGGRLILTTRSVYPLADGPRDYWRFTRYGLAKLFEQWRIVHLGSDQRSFSALGALLQRLCYQVRLRGGKATKLVLFVLAYVLDHLNWLVVEEYGQITRETVEVDIFSTGVHIIVEK